LVHRHTAEPWSVTLVNTGIQTMTGGRVKRAQRYIGDEPFLLTYGDGVADVNIRELVAFHKSHGKLATVTACQPGGRFGAMELSKTDQVLLFQEKPKGDGAWVNAGFFVFQPAVFDYLEGDQTVLEKKPLETLASKGELAAFKHTGFWHPMDTQRDKTYLEELWGSGTPPWKVWG